MASFNIGNNQANILRSPRLIKNISKNIKSTIDQTMNELAPTFNAGVKDHKKNLNSFKLSSSTESKKTYSHSDCKDILRKAITDINRELPELKEGFEGQNIDYAKLGKIKEFEPPEEKEDKKSSAQIFGVTTNNTFISKTNIKNIANILNSSTKEIIKQDSKNFSRVNIKFKRQLDFNIDIKTAFYNDMSAQMSKASNTMETITNYMETMNKIELGGIESKTAFNQLNSLVNSTELLSVRYYRDMMKKPDDYSKEEKNAISPIINLASNVLLKVLPRPFKEAIRETETIYKSLPLMLNNKFKEMISNDNQLVAYFGNKFYKGTEPSNEYKKGPVEWDGITRRAIVNVIPGILAKIERGVKGKGINEEKVYDYVAGGFRTYGSVKMASQKQFESGLFNDTSIGSFKNEILKYTGGSSKEVREVDNALRTMVLRKDIPSKNTKFSKNNSINNAIYSAWMKTSSSNKSNIMMSIVSLESPEEWISKQESFHNVADVLDFSNVFKSNEDMEKEMYNYLTKHGATKLAQRFKAGDTPEPVLSKYNPFRYMTNGIRFANDIVTGALTGGNDATNKVKNVFIGIGGYFKKLFSKPLSDQWKSITNSIKLSDANTLFTDTLKNSNIFSNMKEFATELKDNFNVKTKSVRNLINKYFTEPLGNVINACMINPIVNGITGTVQFFTRIFTGMKNKISNEHNSTAEIRELDTIQQGLTGSIVNDKLVNKEEIESEIKPINFKGNRKERRIKNLVYMKNKALLKVYDSLVNDVLFNASYYFSSTHSDIINTRPTNKLTMLETTNSIHKINKYLKYSSIVEYTPLETLKDKKKKEGKKSKIVKTIKFYSKFSNIKNKIKSVITAKREKRNRRKNIRERMRNAIASGFVDNKDILKEKSLALFTSINDVISKIKPMLEKTGKDIKPLYNNIKKNIFKTIGHGFKNLFPLARQIGGVLMQDSKALLKELGHFTSEVVPTTKEALGSIYSTYKDMNILERFKDMKKEAKKKRMNFNIVGGHVDYINKRIKVQTYIDSYEESKMKIDRERAEDEEKRGLLAKTADKAKGLITGRVTARNERMADMVSTAIEGASKVFGPIGTAVTSGAMNLAGGAISMGKDFVGKGLTAASTKMSKSKNKTVKKLSKIVGLGSKLSDTAMDGFTRANATDVYVVGGSLDGGGLFGTDSSGDGFGVDDVLDIADTVDDVKDLKKLKNLKSVKKVKSTLKNLKNAKAVTKLKNVKAVTKVTKSLKTAKNAKGVVTAIKGLKGLKNIGGIASALGAGGAAAAGGSILATGGAILLPLAGMWLADRAFKGLEGWFNAEENFGVEKATLGMKASSAAGSFLDAILPGDQSGWIQGIYNGSKNIGSMLKNIGTKFLQYSPIGMITKGFKSLFGFSDKRKVENAKQEATSATELVKSYNKELNTSTTSRGTSNIKDQMKKGALNIGKFTLGMTIPGLSLAHKVVKETDVYKRGEQMFEAQFLNKLTTKEREDYLMNRNGSVYSNLLKGQDSGKFIRMMASVSFLGNQKIQDESVSAEEFTEMTNKSIEQVKPIIMQYMTQSQQSPSGGSTNSSLSGNTQATVFMDMDESQFIETIGGMARADYPSGKILPSITIAQAIHESGWGKSGLTQKANNLFGIKAGSSWQGETINMATGEVLNGQSVTINDNFRKYNSVEESIVDHGKFFQASRYANVLSATTPEEQAEQIYKCGYATDPSYASKILSYVNKHNLKNFDQSLDQIQAGGDVIGGNVSASGFMWPVPGQSRISSKYGYRIHPITGDKKMHHGIDIASPSGVAIVATKAGKVTQAKYSGGYGNLTIIDHGGGYTSRYAHQSKFATSVGATVNAGQVIGYVGSTGASTGPHLHFEIRIGNDSKNPTNFVSASGSTSSTTSSSGRSAVMPKGAIADEVIDPKNMEDKKIDTELLLTSKSVAYKDKKADEEMGNAVANTSLIGCTFALLEDEEDLSKTPTGNTELAKSYINSRTDYEDVNKLLTVARQCTTDNAPKVAILSTMVNILNKLDNNTENLAEKDIKDDIPENDNIKPIVNNKLNHENYDMESVRAINTEILYIARGYC